MTAQVQADMDLAAHTMSPSMRQGTSLMLASLHETFNTLDSGATLLDNAAVLPNGASVDRLDSVLSEVMVIADQLEAQNTERVSVLSGATAPAL